MADVKILLVEDESIEALDIKHTLESFGYEVPYVASTGKEAVDKALEITPDLILMDIILKGNQDGIDAAYEIKNLKIPLIYLTAHSEESTIERAKLTEPYGYIIKPYDSNELKYAIELAIYKSVQEKKLKESEERYRMLFENSQVSTAITSMDGNVLAANERFFQMVGYSHDEIRKIDLKALYQDTNQRNVIIQLLKERGKIRDYEVELLRKDGTHYTNSINVDMIRYQDEDAMLVTAIEITERKKAEMALKKSEKRYRNLYSTMSEGLAIHEVIYDDNQTPVDYKILDVNPSYEQILGIQKDDILGKKASEIYETGQAPYLDVYSKVAETGKPAQFETYFEPMDKYFSISVFSPSKGTFVTVFEDITERKNLELDLKKSELKYRTLFETMAMGVVYQDFNGKIISANPAAGKILGLTLDEMLGRTSTDPRWRSINEDGSDLPGEEHPAMVALKTGKNIKNAVMGVFDPKKEETRWININAFPQFKGDESKPYQVFTTFEDISEKKKAEFLLKKQKQELEKAVEELKNINKALMKRDDDFRHFIDDAPIAISMFDTQMNYIAASLRWIEDYNLQGQELLGKSHYEIFPEITDELKEVHKQALAGSMVRSDGDKFVRADGSVQYVRWEVRPWYLSAGDIGGIIIFSEDISESRIAEKELRESEEKYRHVVETAAEGIALFDKKGTVLETNQKIEELMGFEKGELVGKNIAQIVPLIKGDTEEILQAFDDIVEGKPIPKQEWEFVNGKGQHKFVKSNHSLMEKDGEINAIALILEDITALKLREKSIKESLMEKEALLREIHHRVKNNMQIISSLLNLQTSFVHEDETKDVLKDSQSRVKSMAMIHEKLYMSRDLSHINFREYTEKLVSDIFYIYGIKIGTIQPQVDVENIELNMETAIPLGLIINELVTNSLKFAFPQDTGSITVKLETNNGEHTLIVADDGMGLPEDIDYGKTGSLGLELVKNLVNQIEGTITIDKTNGTEFKIKFKELDYKERL